MPLLSSCFSVYIMMYQYHHLVRRYVHNMFMSMSHLALTVIQSHIANTKTEEPTFAKLQRWVSELQKQPFYSFHPNLAKNRLGSLQRRWPQELCNSGLMTLRPGRCKKSGAKWGLRDNPTSRTAHVLVESARHLECETIKLHKIFMMVNKCKNSQAHTAHWYKI